MSIRQGNNIIAGGGSEEDNLSITKNTNNKIQTVGVIDQNDNTSAIKVWTGELADLPATKDPMTLYNVTDDVDGGESVYTKTEVDTLLGGKENVGVAYTKAESDSLLTTMLQALYPVGSIYIGTQSVCPLASMIPGSTWQQIQGRYLLASGTIAGTSESSSAGSYISAGLPNVAGSIDIASDRQNQSGALYWTNNKTGTNGGGAGGQWIAGFSAQNSNSIYGNSSTVRPAAYSVNVWVRTA